MEALENLSKQDLLNRCLTLEKQLKEVQPKDTKKEFYPTSLTAFDKDNHNLHDFFDNANDLIQVFSLDQKLLFVNEAWKKVLRYTEKQAEQLSLTDIVHPAHKEAIYEYIQKTLAGENLGKFETVFKRKNGKNIHVIGSISCNYVNGQLVAYTGIFSDNTDKVQAENAQQLYYSIANLSIKSENLEDLLEQIHELLIKQIGANNFHVALKEENKDFLTFPYYVDELHGGKLEAYRREFGKGVTEYTFKNKRPVFLYEEDIKTLIEQEEVELYGEIPQIWLGVPLVLDRRITGVIAVKSHSDRNKYKYRDLELLDFISGQIALIIERQRYEDKINAQRARLNAIIESSSHLIWSMNKKGGLTSFNQNYASAIFKKYGKQPQIDLEGLDKQLFLSNPEDDFAIQKFYQKAFEGEEQHFETRFKDKNKIIWREIFLNPIFLPDGRIKEVSGISHNITEKKVSELALKESEVKFRTIFESFQDIYFRTDFSGIMRMVSPSAFELTGYKERELVGQPITSFFINIKSQKGLIKKLLRDGKVKNYEVIIQTKEGVCFQCIANIRLILNDKGYPIAFDGVARDITFLKKASEQLLKAKEIAEHSLKVKENFLANMSHEIRTPMNGLIGVIDLLKATNLDKEQNDLVSTIKKSSSILMNILNDILDLSKLEAGKMELRLQPILVEELLEKLFLLFNQKAQTKDLDFGYQKGVKMPLCIYGDETRLLQILSNVVSNSIKFTERGSVQIYVDLVSQKGDDLELRFSVKDTGIGIAKENVQQLFQNFNQLDNSLTRSYAGTGLGLSISKALSKLMDGEIGVNSELGKGSEFWFTIQASICHEIPKREEEDIFDLRKEKFEHSPTILLVDDNQVNQRVASMILQKVNCIVEIANNGKEAVEKVEKVNGFYDLVLMDIQMPIMDGITATKEIKKKELANQPKIVAMTAYSMEEDKARFLDAGVDDYLPKPITAEMLIKKVQSLYQGKSIVTREKEEVKNTQESSSILDKKVINQLIAIGGKEMVIEVLTDFIEETEELLSECDEALKTEDLPIILSNLHTLKGLAGTVGVSEVASWSLQIEQKLKKENDVSFLQKNYSNLVKAFSLFKESFPSILD